MKVITMLFVLSKLVALGKSLPLWKTKAVDPKSFQVPSSLMLHAQMLSAHHKG